MENLWPQFTKKEVETPKSILNKQVEYFNDLDIGLRAYLSTHQGRDASEFISMDSKVYLIHTLRIQTSALEGFTFTLLRAKHKTIQIYPVEVLDNMTEINYEASNPDELIEILKKIFSTTETKEAIQNILTQIQTNDIDSDEIEF